MYSKISLLVTGLFLIQTLSMVSAQQKFSTVFYDPVGAVLGYSITRTLDNNFIIAGEKDTRALVMKIDPAGTVLWKKSVGDLQGVFYTVAPTRDGGAILAGKINNAATSHTDIYCAKLDAAGDTVWTQAIDMGFDDEALSVKQTLDDGFILSGDAATGGMFVVKLDAAGHLTWGKLYTAGNYINIASGIDQASDSSYVVTGVYGNQPAFTSDMFLMKINTSGQVIWSEKETLSGIHYFSGFDVKIVANEIYCLYSTQDSGWVVAKLDISGTPLWSKYYNGLTVGHVPGYGPKLCPTADGGFLFDFSGTFFPGELIKIDGNGALLWSQFIWMSATMVAESSSGDLVLTGNGPIFGVGSNSTLNPQLGIVGTDATGTGITCTEPQTTTTGNYPVLVSAITVTPSVAGTASTLISPVVDATITTETGCVLFTGGIFEKTQNAISIRVFPNPTEGTFSVAGSGKTPIDIDRIEIVDMHGNVVYRSRENQDLRLPIDPGNIAPGLYTVRAFSAKMSGTEEIVICR